MTVLVKHGPFTRGKKADVATFPEAVLLLHVLSWGPCSTRTVIGEAAQPLLHLFSQGFPPSL